MEQALTGKKEQFAVLAEFLMVHGKEAQHGEAAARLGMQPVIVDGSSTQIAHGETAGETGAMLGMNSHALGIRHVGETTARDLAKARLDYAVGVEPPLIREVPRKHGEDARDVPRPVGRHAG